MSELLSIQNVTKSFKNEKQTQIVLKNVNLQIDKNEFVCILGPSGCGKTTLLRCIAGFEYFEGSIYLESKKIVEPSRERSMVFQEFNQLFPWKTVEENLKIGLRLAKTNKEDINNIVEKYLKKVGLYEYKNYYPHQLSGGMKQRVAIARSLSLRPKVILMDEPFASLDAMTREKLQQELIKIKEEEDITIIFVTHNINEAIILGSRILVMSFEGRINLDLHNELKQPITPATNGFGIVWKKLYNALETK